MSNKSSAVIERLKVSNEFEKVIVKGLSVTSSGASCQCQRDVDLVQVYAGIKKYICMVAWALS